MTEVKVRRLSFLLEWEVVGFFEKHVTKFGNGAKIDCPKEYLGKPYTCWCAENDLPRLREAPEARGEARESTR